jgi:ABC-2 type transport system permease protein
MENILWTIKDTATLTWRNALKYKRLPQLIVFSTIQPVMFVLLFAYVFGGAIKIPGVNYINFLLPGILVQTVLFGSMNTGIGLAEDMAKGIIERFKSLPMARSAVLTGRTLADAGRNIFVVVLIVVVGHVIGFRFQNGLVNALGAMGLLVLFGFAFSWISAAIGLSVKNIETAQVAGFIWIFPLAFISSIFVPVQTMPSFLQHFAEYSPVTVTVNASRALSLGGPAANSVLQSLAWIAGILAVFVPLAVNRYKKIS